VDWPWWVWLLVGLWCLPWAACCGALYFRALRMEIRYYRSELARREGTPRALRRQLRRTLFIYTGAYLLMFVGFMPFSPVVLLAALHARAAGSRRSPRSYRARIIPALDLQNGQIVRGVAGRREEYLPVVSRLTLSAEPLAVARAFWEHFRLNRLYLADLDAIAGSPPALATYTALRADGFRLWVDAGIRRPEDARALAEVRVEGFVAGLETLSGPEALRTLCQVHGSERVIFSLDLKGGQPLTGNSAWRGTDAHSIAEEAVACGVRRLIVLDLVRVGVGEGTGTEAFCASLAETYPDLEIIAGGGVRDVADLRRLRKCGVRGVLVASALHDGWLTRADLEGL
jgi:phosphoribosylformimino-5-aminoimidazole carboxamide ribotide isomerase